MTGCPPCADLGEIRIVRGASDPPLQLRVAPMVGAGSQWRLVFLLPFGRTLTLSTLAGDLTAVAGVAGAGGDVLPATIVTWVYTPAQSLQFPRGVPSILRLEHISPGGAESLIATARVIGV